MLPAVLRCHKTREYELAAISQSTFTPSWCKYSGIYGMLPSCVQEYLDGCSKKEQGKVLRILAELSLKSSFEQAASAVAKVLSYGVKDLALWRFIEV